MKNSDELLCVRRPWRGQAPSGTACQFSAEPLRLERGGKILLLGGSKSGKSLHAEAWTAEAARRFGGGLYYLATLVPGDDAENRERITRHRNQRARRGFTTLERPRNILPLRRELADGSIVLLDCLGNLLANELFAHAEAQWPERAAALPSILRQELNAFARGLAQIILVSNLVFEDAESFDRATTGYRQALGELHGGLIEDGWQAFEMTAGFAVVL